jgi:phage shock protein PspC (stress-responsive transcriptional regulator)
MADADAMDEQTAFMNDEQVVSQTIGSTPGPDPTGVPPRGAGGPRPPWHRLPVFRDRSDNLAGGVVSGLCQTYGFDRRTTRIALVLASFVLPVLVLVYLIAWILLPDSRAEARPLADVFGDRRRFPLYVALGLVVVAGGLGSIGSWFVFGDFPWGVGLIALGVLLWMTPTLRPGRRRFADAPSPGESTSSGSTGAAAFPLPANATVTTASDTVIDPATGDFTTELPTATTPATGLDGAGGSGGAGHYGSDGRLLLPPPMPAPSRRRRIPIGSITLLAVAAFIAIVSAGDAIDWWDVPVLGVVVTSIIALAAGLAISTVVNGAWFFVPIVLVLAGAAGCLLVTEPSLDGGVGERTSRPSTVADAERPHDLALGELTLDLVDVPLDADQPVQVSAEVGVGRLHVIVPAGATLVLVNDVGAGQVVIGDREVFAGVRQDDRRTIAAIGAPTGTIELDLRVGIGEIDIDRDVFTVVAPEDTAGPLAPLVPV